MTRSTLIVASLVAIAFGCLIWFNTGEPPAQHERSLSPGAEMGPPDGRPHESLEGDGPSASGEASETGRRVVQITPLTGQGSSVDLRTTVSGLFVDHRGDPLPGRRLTFRTSRGSRSVETNAVGGFRRTVHGAWLPRIESGSAAGEELRVWGSSPPVDKRLSELLEVAEGAFRLKLVGRTPDYVQKFELCLPDGRPHAKAGVILRYRIDHGDWAGWHETQSSTDARGRVSFRLW